MKKTFIDASVEIVEFDVCDVLTTSTQKENNETERG